jgi:hypothetical protein
MVEGSQQLSDRGPQLGDGVLGGDGVVDGGRVEHPHPPLHGTGRGCHDLGVLEQPPRRDRSTQAIALPGKNRCMECLGAGVDAGGCLPAEVEAESVTGLPIRQSLECLQQHHRGQHAGRDRRSSLHRAGVQIGEVVVTEHHVTVVGEEAIDRSELQPVTEKIPRVLEALLGLRGPERHGQILSAAQVKLRDPLGDHFCSLLERPPSSPAKPFFGGGRPRQSSSPPTRVRRPTVVATSVDSAPCSFVSVNALCAADWARARCSIVSRSSMRRRSRGVDDRGRRFSGLGTRPKLV